MSFIKTLPENASEMDAHDADGFFIETCVLNMLPCLVPHVRVDACVSHRDCPPPHFPRPRFFSFYFSVQHMVAKLAIVSHTLFYHL
jgi:hypothetical protein